MAAWASKEYNGMLVCTMTERVLLETVAIDTSTLVFLAATKPAFNDTRN